MCLYLECMNPYIKHSQMTIYMAHQRTWPADGKQVGDAVCAYYQKLIHVGSGYEQDM